MNTGDRGSQAVNTSSPAENLGIYLEMAKARLAAMVVFSTIAGYLLSARGSSRLDTMLWTAVGTALAAFGANIFNQILEVDLDAKMERTENRPLPSGRITTARALVYASLSSAAGVVLLAVMLNTLTAALALAVILLYTLVYTPMKTRTSANTLIGAVVGAVPPVIGWTAFSGRIEAGALILFGILFTWQVPHFLALAWMYREDYARGGFKMLPTVDGVGRFTARTAFVYALALQPLTLLVYTEGLSGMTFLVIAQILSLTFALAALPLYRDRSRVAARRLFLTSIVYLPLLLISMVGDMDERVFNGTPVGTEPQPEVDLARFSHELPTVAPDTPTYSGSAGRVPTLQCFATRPPPAHADPFGVSRLRRYRPSGRCAMSLHVCVGGAAKNPAWHVASGASLRNRVRNEGRLADSRLPGPGLQ